MTTTDATTSPRRDKYLHAAHDLAGEIAKVLNADLSVRFWDGSAKPLGENVSSPLVLAINDPGVIATLLRRPSLDRIIKLYAHGRIDFEGGTLIDIGHALGKKSTRKRLKDLPRLGLLKKLAIFALLPGAAPERSREFSGDATGENRAKRDEKAFIGFHYDVSNDFYKLFLDDNMIYTCAYFRDWGNSLDQAQLDKLDMICRKLRMQPGERFLDIGCGWGGLICHAAKHYGVRAHGVTLAEEQFAYARDRIKREGLSDLVTVELKDYRDVTGRFDKISSIGMYEAIGVPAIPEYLSKIRSLLKPGGLFLNHGITRKAKRKKTRFTARPEQAALVKYIFPGGELDDIGNTISELERHRFEVHDVEGWREHYQLTTRLWTERLTARKSEAVALVGEQTYRIWVAYLAGCSLAFERGSVGLYQTLSSTTRRGPANLPPTREDLYRDQS